MAVNSVHNTPKADATLQRTEAASRVRQQRDDAANTRQNTAEQHQAQQQQSNQVADTRKLAEAKAVEKQSQERVNVKV
jgi:hypothetical protein